MVDGIFQENNTLAPTDESVLSLFSLKGKTAIVSGSGAGIGYAVVQAFAEAGANVAIWVRMCRHPDPIHRQSCRRRDADVVVLLFE